MKRAVWFASLLALSSPVLMLACSDSAPAGACDDGQQSGDETDIDCGGALCQPCGLDQRCVADTDCVAAGRCSGGTCVAREPACVINGATVAAGEIDPANPCGDCEPAVSATEWSALPDGTDCGAGLVCASGSCSPRCFIDGALYEPGAVDPDDACQQCAPATSIATWSTRPDGASCAADGVCEAGACSTKCFIDGVLYAPADPSPANGCEQCDPAASTTDWTVLADGASCDVGKVCDAGSCAAECYIDGVLYAPADPSPANGCDRCDPAAATTDWTVLADGASCDAGKVCDAGSCESECYIDGSFYAADTVRDAHPCQQCTPASSTSAWSSRGTISLLAGGTDVAAQGWSTTAQTPYTITYGADYVELATSTASGATTSGQLLLYLPEAVEVGQPFTIRVEARVVAVDAHNQFDSGAAILGSFTPPFGANADRSEMIYLDSAAIGWADNTQSAAVAVQDGAYHVFELAVDAAGAASVSVDGVARLTRAGFVTSGTIAVGDQTNDAHVDGVMRIRSVSRICP
jgi:hypothetical protein